MYATKIVSTTTMTSASFCRYSKYSLDKLTCWNAEHTNRHGFIENNEMFHRKLREKREVYCEYQKYLKQKYKPNNMVTTYTQYVQCSLQP